MLILPMMKEISAIPKVLGLARCLERSRISAEERNEDIRDDRRDIMPDCVLKVLFP